MLKEILLDCTMLESPEPLNLVIQNLGNISKTTYIKMIHRMQPMMLFNILDQNGFKYITMEENNQVEIYIFKEEFYEEQKRCIQD
ncbi:hypothetical protein [Arcobacter arenosus]|jgi:hypothetical protein|uniref:DUF2249 domain-containing protein n=1 Tax=Arcobacter arenosus TaxID=2576037 RepID=A0A5R8XZG3_9BACT|nr:hypothetical protein [Arcobacter arenosus]TLP37075.1 hypothetical protein FDK22_12590 [Arcobacter arenosus]